MNDIEKSPGSSLMHDRAFISPVAALSRDKAVFQAAEKAMNLASNIVSWQMQAGVEPGSIPFDVLTALDNADDGVDDESKSLHSLQCQHQMKSACDAYDALVKIYQRSYEGRWTHLLANSINAMDLNDGQSELGSVLRHALEQSCTTARLVFEKPARSAKHLSRPLSANATDIGVNPTQAPGSAVGLNARPILKRDFWDATAHRGRFKAGAHIHAQIVLIAVSVQRDESDLKAVDVSVKSKVRGARAIQSDKLASASGMRHDAATPTEELLGIVGTGQWLSEQLLPLLPATPNELGCAVVVIPRLFRHEEFNKISLQTLNDMPLCVARAIESGKTLDDLSLTICTRLGIGEKDESPLDDCLVAKARMHYLFTVIYREVKCEPSPMEMQAVWPDGFTPHMKESFAKALCEATNTVTQLEVMLAPYSGDLFLVALRDGVRRQRAQVMLEQVKELMSAHGVSPEDCYSKIVHRTSEYGPDSELSLQIFNGWLQGIGELPWPNLQFDSMESQRIYLDVLSNVLGFRERSRVFLVSDKGSD